MTLSLEIRSTNVVSEMKYVNKTEETNFFSSSKAPSRIIQNLITLIQRVNNLLNEMCYFGAIKKGIHYITFS